MRGSTNAVPAGGGLKVIASGQLSAASSATTVTLPQPAQLVIVCAHMAEDVGNSAVIVRGGRFFSDYIMMTNDGRGEYRLSQDGLTITYRALTSGAYYVAFG